MKLHELSPALGSNRAAWRKGRGIGSGNGKTAGRGHKGGQTTLARCLPKRGFNNVFAKHYAEVNVGSLNAFEDGDTVCVVSMLEKGVIGKACDGVKVLGNGQLTKKLTVKAASFSKSAKEKIEAAGGKAEVV